MLNHQLDIFDDGRDVALRNDIAAAVAGADAAAARLALAALRAEFGGDAVTDAATRLVGWLDAAPTQALRASTVEVLATRRELEQEIAPAARVLMGSEAAGPWMAAQWRQLALRASHLPWQPESPDAHPACLLLQAAAWGDAAAAVEGIESWRRIPQPLLWMVQARWRHEGADAAWPLLAEALWLATARAMTLIGPVADPQLARLARRFEAAFDPEAAADWAWLPAWALVDQPALAAVLTGAQPPANNAPAEGFKLVVALLRLERQGRHHEVVEHRKRLRGLSSRLFECYMATR